MRFKVEFECALNPLSGSSFNALFNALFNKILNANSKVPLNALLIAR